MEKIVILYKHPKGADVCFCSLLYSQKVTVSMRPFYCEFFPTLFHHFPQLCIKNSTGNYPFPSFCSLTCGTFILLSGSKALHGGLQGFCYMFFSLSPPLPLSFPISIYLSIVLSVNQSIHLSPYLSLSPSPISTQSLQHELFQVLALSLSFCHYLRMNPEPSCFHNYRSFHVR